MKLPHLVAVFFCLAVLPAEAQRLSPLASVPDWAQLETFHETITREEFVHLLDHVYAPGGAAKGMVEWRGGSPSRRPVYAADGGP